MNSNIGLAAGGQRALASYFPRRPLSSIPCMNSYYSQAQFLLGYFGFRSNAREAELVARENALDGRVRQVDRHEQNVKEREASVVTELKVTEQRQKAVEEREDEVSEWSEQVDALERDVERRHESGKSIPKPKYLNLRIACTI